MCRRMLGWWGGEEEAVGWVRLQLNSAKHRPIQCWP